MFLYLEMNVFNIYVADYSFCHFIVLFASISLAFFLISVRSYLVLHVSK